LGLEICASKRFGLNRLVKKNVNGLEFYAVQHNFATLAQLKETNLKQ